MPLSRGGLVELLKDILTEFSEVYIIVDALDECATWDELLAMLEEIVGWELQHVHVIVTSRKELEIEKVLEDFKGPGKHICIQNDAVDKDIILLVKQQLISRKSLERKTAGIKASIENALTKGAQGM